MLDETKAPEPVSHESISEYFADELYMCPPGEHACSQHQECRDHWLAFLKEASGTETLIARVQELEQELDQFQTRLVDLRLGNGIDLSLKGPFAKSLFDNFVGMFEEAGGKNFLAITLQGGDGRKYSVIIQDCHKRLTPAEKLGQMAARVQELEQLWSDAEARCTNLDAELDITKAELKRAYETQEQIREEAAKTHNLAALLARGLEEEMDRQVE